MKTLKYSFGILLSILAIATFNSCEEEADYTPATAPAGERVYFPSTAGSQIDITQETETFEISVCRTAAGEAMSVPVVVTADSLANTVFDFPATIEFADSAKTASYTISVKEGVVPEYDVYYNVSIAIDESMTTPYGISTYEFTVGVPAPWSEWAPIEGHEEGTFNFSLYVNGSYSIPVSYREYKLDDVTAQFKLHTTEIGTNSDIIVNYNKETGACQVDVHNFLNSEKYGPVFVSDMPHYPLQPGIPYDNYPCSFDPETGLMSLNLIYFVSADLGSAANGYFAQGVETVQLDGFKQYDYSLAMQYRGHYVDNNGVDNAVISTTKGVDVAQYLMTVIGSDEDAQATVSGMLDGSVPCDTLSESGFYAYPITESGNYVALAITFDAEGNAMDAYTEEFEFFMVGEDNPWVSLGYAKYTDDLVLSLFGNEPMTYKVEILENQEQPGLFRMVDPYGPNFPMYPYASSYKEGSYIEIDATDPEGVWIENIQSTGLDIQNNGLMSVVSMAWYQVATTEGATKEDAKEAGLCGVYADGVITFPVDAVRIVIGNSMFNGNMNGAFKLDMSNMTPVGGEENGEASEAPAARMMSSLKVNESAATGFKFGIRAKKIDSSFMTPTNAELK